MLDSSEWAEAILHPFVDHMHTHIHIPQAACSLREPSPPPPSSIWPSILTLWGPNISFHHCYQRVNNTVVSTSYLILGSTHISWAEDTHDRWCILLQFYQYNTVFSWICVSAYRHTCMLMWAPWANSSSWHSAPWREEEAKCRAEKPLSFTWSKVQNNTIKDKKLSRICYLE